jgi:anionic cell wall polymer biosynthesis LytR-Cps2A-Psr (LCP) family protein
LIITYKTIAITSVLVAAALTGIFSTSAYATNGGDESEKNTEQEIKQKNVGSGESTNNNCALNSIDTTTAATVACPVGPLLGFVDGRLVEYD